MLEVKIPGVSRTAFYAGATAYSGMISKITGLWPSAMVSSSGAGWARAGDLMCELLTSSDDATVPHFVMGKYIMKVEDADKESDMIYSGQAVQLWEGGEYETDRLHPTTWARDSWFTTGGFPIYVSGGYLTTSGHGGVAGYNVRRYRLIQNQQTSYDSNYHQTGLVWFRHMPATPLSDSGVDSAQWP